MRADRALFRRLPQLAGVLPWLSIGSFPTPVQPLTSVLDGLWVKRDDLSGATYGGNKVRKLELLLGEARQRGARRLITAGAAGSHHALATAAYGRAHGFAVTLVLFPQHRTQHVRDVLLMDAALGAELRLVRRMELLPVALRAIAWSRRRDRPFVLPPGGSSPHAVFGYVCAALEFAEQVAAGGAPEPDVTYVAAGTLGTVAGLAIGFELAGLRTVIRAVRVSPRIVASEAALRRLIAAALRIGDRAGARMPALADVLRRVTLVHDQIGAGYGLETRAGREAIERFAAAGIGLDATYTAKAAAALLSDARELPSRVRLYWHTLSAATPVELPPDAGTDRLPPAFRAYLERPAG